MKVTKIVSSIVLLTLSNISMANIGKLIANTIKADKKGAYVMCANEDKDYKYPINSKDEYLYFDRKWRSFETKKEVKGLFFPDSSESY